MADLYQVEGLVHVVRIDLIEGLSETLLNALENLALKDILL